MKEYSVIGKGVLRKDALDKVTGAAIFTPDIQPKGMVFGKYLGSTVPHGIIKKIDTLKAEALNGVLAVITGKDMPENRTAGYIMDRHPICKKRVRYVGDPVAAVAAISEEIADRALDLIEVEYEELPAVFDYEEAWKSDCPVVIHPDLLNYGGFQHHNVCLKFDPEHKNQILHRKIRHGNIEDGFAKADVIYEGEYRVPRAHPCAMETHNCVVIPDPDGGFTVHASEQGGLIVKGALCGFFGIEDSKLRFATPYLGGGFGSKCDILVTPIAIVLAKKTGKPIKIEMSREEVFLSGSPRCPAVVRIKDGIMKDGTLVAREITELMDGGAYSTFVTVMISEGVYGATGTYRIPNFKMDAYGAYTNTAPNGPFRSLGSEILAFAIECQMDAIAEKLGIDKIEIRKKNILRNGDIDVIGQTTESNATDRLLETVEEKLDWKSGRRAPEGPWVFGKSVSIGNKFSSCGSSGTGAMAKVYPDGRIELRYFHVELGQGADTILCQIAAEEFGVDIDQIFVNPRDSAFCPHDEGTYCSRGTFVNGNAVILACRDAKRQIIERGSQILRLPIEKLETTGGKVLEKGNPDNGVGYNQLYEFGGWLPEGGEILGKATFKGTEGTYDPETGQGNPVDYYSHGALGFEVAINCETGEIKILKAVGYFDMGQPINEILVSGQIEGAIAMGIGQALHEEIILNNQGKVINANFRDYKIPTALDIPNNDCFAVGHVGDPLSRGPYGGKGFGEVSLVPVAPGVANAINDALGVKITQLPLTKERVFNAIKASERIS